MAVIVAAVFTALAAASSGPAWAQETGDADRAPAASQVETMAPAGMRVMMGAQSDGSDAAPLTGHGFLLDKGVFTTIEHPDAVAEAAALGINNRGQIVGGYVDAEGTVRSFLLDDGVFTPIEHPDAASGSATGTAVRSINDRGQIVGFYVDAEEAVHGFLMIDGAFTTIDHPDAPSESGVGTAAFGLNNRGQIVGQYIDAELLCHGLLLSRGAFTTIDDPDAQLTTGASDINDRGQIVGFRDGLTGLKACPPSAASTSAAAPDFTEE